MTPDEYIAESGKELMYVEQPLGFLVKFYCNLFGITVFKGIYPAFGKLIKQYGEGTVYQAIVKNYYKGTKHSRDTYYKNILFTAIGIQKKEKQSESEPTSLSYADYLKLRESVNV